MVMNHDVFGELILTNWLKMRKLEDLKLEILAQNPSFTGIYVRDTQEKPKIKKYRSIDEPWGTE